MGHQIEGANPHLPVVWSDGGHWHRGVSMVDLEMVKLILQRPAIILLGRLQLTIDEAIDAYIKLLPALSVGPARKDEEKRETQIYLELYSPKFWKKQVLILILP